jgi:hypothetical protein
MCTGPRSTPSARSIPTCSRKRRPTSDATEGSLPARCSASPYSMCPPPRAPWLWRILIPPRTLRSWHCRAKPERSSRARSIPPSSPTTSRYAQRLQLGKDRIDALMRQYDLTALLFANSGNAVIGAKAGYPAVTVPAEYQPANRRPFNVAFLWQAWREPTVIGYYDYEQATELANRLRRSTPASSIPPPRSAAATLAVPGTAADPVALPLRLRTGSAHLHQHDR